MKIMNRDIILIVSYKGGIIMEKNIDLHTTKVIFPFENVDFDKYVVLEFQNEIAESNSKKDEYFNLIQELRKQEFDCTIIPVYTKYSSEQNKYSETMGKLKNALNKYMTNQKVLETVEQVDAAVSNLFLTGYLVVNKLNKDKVISLISPVFGGLVEINEEDAKGIESWINPSNPAYLYAIGQK